MTDEETRKKWAVHIYGLGRGYGPHGLSSGTDDVIGSTLREVARAMWRNDMCDHQWNETWRCKECGIAEKKLRDVDGEIMAALPKRRRKKE